MKRNSKTLLLGHPLHCGLNAPPTGIFFETTENGKLLGR
jgi:hypothetical protein